ncbi:efflux RND transporter periplasmic adaptor subunit [Crocinitomicaceae bacterium CZZ-1]|uniref:Efflux RND transporter periplasmic adaptor subunit n=1 Tax=Taishania pollutisoli TaxID=2766479 RepID=A0A8J6PEY1_9FLAO|nr:efflux RND transporter periplasmic adaptor subunit [Taishania pollutisoli]MBC9813273.1 efflux RND transporter periplasmic adaptor subunit [Taishania pollutisoli]MBX2948956.1 efflux RND transporter periplasmic adaptor subunit [Crocinitomicaceae bacterium]NGF76999.1 efflux RND transporter periplasmic adaptor subunit [Fluviicola sp. SGL-29]
MKKIIITVLVVAAAIGGIVWTLQNNKKENQSKIDIVSKGTGAVPVKVMTVKREAINVDFAVNGKLAANQDLMLISEVNGRVLSIRVKEGDRVTQGQVLATVESTYSSLDYQAANDALQKLKVDQQRLTSALKTGGVTQSQVDEINLAVKNAESQLAQAKKRLSDASIKAPISGIINKKYIEVGSFAAAGTQLFNIVDVSSLKLNVTANERQVVQLGVGYKVDITVPVFQDETFTGAISFIAPKADNSLNYPIEIKLDNTKTKNKLKAGMYASAEFKFGDQTPIIAIPRTAFVGSVNSGEVFVIEKEGVATLRKVSPGAIFGESVEILGGLKEGETVITTGQINLINGTPIEVLK